MNGTYKSETLSQIVYNTIVTTQTGIKMSVVTLGKGEFKNDPSYQTSTTIVLDETQVAALREFFAAEKVGA